MTHAAGSTFLIHKNAAKVAVIMPVHNGEDYIASALDSVLGQSFQEFEIIIINDGSTDSTRERIRPYLSDHRIRYFENTPNIGASRTRNRAISACSAEFITFLDHDDLWHPDKLFIQLLAFEQEPQLCMVHADMALIDSAGELLPRYRGLPSSKYSNSAASLLIAPDLDGLIRCNTIQILTVMARRKCIEDAGGFPEYLSAAEDYGLWLKMALNHPIGYQKTIVASYRIHDSQVSKNGYKMLAQRLYMLERFISDNPGDWRRTHSKTLRRRMGHLHREVANHLLIDQGDAEQARSHYLKALGSGFFDIRCVIRAVWCFVPATLRALAHRIRRKSNNWIKDGDH